MEDIRRRKGFRFTTEGGVNRGGNEPRETMNSGKQTEVTEGRWGGDAVTG